MKMKWTADRVPKTTVTIFFSGTRYPVLEPSGIGTVIIMILFCSSFGKKNPVFDSIRYTSILIWDFLFFYLHFGTIFLFTFLLCIIKISSWWGWYGWTYIHFHSYFFIWSFFGYFRCFFFYFVIGTMFCVVFFPCGWLISSRCLPMWHWLSFGKFLIPGPWGGRVMVFVRKKRETMLMTLAIVNY